MAIIPIIGSDIRSDSQDANFQVLFNMMELDAGANARSATVLKPTAGTKLLVDLGGGSCRGMITISGKTYVVCDNAVYSMIINPLAETCTIPVKLGTLNSSTGKITMKNNPTQLMITDNSAIGYIVTLSTGALAPIADIDFVGGSSLVYYDGYFVTSQPVTASMQSSSANDGTTWSSTDVAIAENKPDNIQGMAINKNEIWVYGTDSVEVWYDAANAVGFPLSPRVGSVLSIGCIAPASIVEMDDLVMWLDNRGFVVQSDISTYMRSQSSGYLAQVVSSTQMNTIFSKYDAISDAIACTFVERGHIMYQITFPTPQKTWVYDTYTKKWFERGTYSIYHGANQEHVAQYTNTIDTHTICCGYLSGKVYLMSSKYFTDAGASILRKHTSAPIFSNNNLIRVNCLTIRAGSLANEVAPGNIPQINVRYSNDGYHTWSYFMPRDLGKTGEYGRPIDWNRLGCEREWEFEITITDPVDFSIIEGFVLTNIETVE